MRPYFLRIPAITLLAIATFVFGCRSDSSNNNKNTPSTEPEIIGIRPGKPVGAQELAAAYEYCGDAAIQTVAEQVYKTKFTWEYIADPDIFQPRVTPALARVKTKFFYTVMNLDQADYGDWRFSESNEIRVYSSSNDVVNYYLIKSVKGTVHAHQLEMTFMIPTREGDTAELKLTLSSMPHFTWSSFNVSTEYDEFGALNYSGAELNEVNLMIPAKSSELVYFTNAKTKALTKVSFNQLEYANCLMRQIRI